MAQFQSEWKTEKSKHANLIIPGRTVNSISYGILDKSNLVNEIFTFYFEYDEKINLWFAIHITSLGTSFPLQKMENCSAEQSQKTEKKFTHT